MANAKEREKRRAARRRKNETALLKAQDSEEVISDDDLEEEVEVIETDSEVEQKSMDMSMMGPTSWEEMDAAEQAREQADHVREVTYNIQDLVSNIAYSPLSAEEKASAIKKVGDGFGKRLKEAVTVKKALDMDLLEVQVLIAKDSRHTPIMEKLGDWIEKKKLTAAAENSLSDEQFALVVTRDGKKIRKYPIHDKAHVRNALARAAQMIERGGEAAADAKAAMPKIRAAAKKMGIGKMEKGSSAVAIEKDISGQWRAVMWPSNNFVDFDNDIISESAHREYVDWVNKNMDVAPVFMCHHIPGTLRKSRVDFVGYESGFLLMSAPLEEHEAAGLLRAQLLTDLGMSHGTFVLERNQKDNRIIEKYRMVEVSDLPLENAANPFTDFETLKKEAAMDTRKYLVSVLGSEEEADKYLNKMDMKQKALREAGVEEKEKTEKVETKTETTPEVKDKKVDAPAPSITQIVEAVKKEIDVEGLSEMLTKLSEDAEKVPVLEALVKELSQNHDEALAEKINPPVAKMLAWQKQRKSQSKDTVLKDNDEKDEKLKKSQPEVHWLNQATGTESVAVQ